MNYKDFMNALMDKKTSGVYLIDSEEEFLNDTIIEAVRNTVTVPDFNLVDIKESKVIEDIKTAYETYPVMEDMKYILWRDIDLSKNSIKDYENVLDNLTPDLEKFPNFATFLIFSDNKPFKGKFYKAIQKHGTVVEITRLNRTELESFVGRRFTRSDKKIQKSLVAEIVDRFSYLNKDSEIDLYDVVNTVDKIIANSTSEIVSTKDVNAQLDEVLNLNIFNLTDAISQKNGKTATEAYLSMAHTEDDMFMIYHMIIRQIRNLIGVKSLYQSGHNDSSIMEKVGIKPFELKKNKSFSNNFSLEELYQIHDRLFDMEYRQKSEDFDMNREILMLINKISQ